MSAGPEQTEPAAPAPSTPPSQPPAQPAVTTSMAAFGGNESCARCGARMAPDQRYCLNCGHRRGEPRLPFMDAVVFMESMGSSGTGPGAPPPPPPGEQRSSARMNANAALIAGVATLVLAIGVGFLIGRSGHENSTQAQAPIKVIEVGGGDGGGEAEASTATEESTSASKSNKGGSSAKKGGKQPKTSEVKENSKQEEELAAEKTAETLHAEGPLAKPKAQVGEACEQGTPGCNGKEFTGEFFGEE